MLLCFTGVLGLQGGRWWRCRACWTESTVTYFLSVGTGFPCFCCTGLVQVTVVRQQATTGLDGISQGRSGVDDGW